jgi:anti-sigma regulatory factor (Ser/Thr protein kinase)
MVDYVVVTRWRERRPPRSDERIACWVLDEAPQLQSLRTALLRTIEQRGMPPAIDVTDLSERLTIMATELAGNALPHGTPPTVVAMLRADGQLVIDAADTDRITARVVDHQRPLGEGGLGLPLAERLAADVGWYPSGTGKHVWATFTVVSPN